MAITKKRVSSKINFSEEILESVSKKEFFQHTDNVGEKKEDVITRDHELLRLDDSKKRGGRPSHGEVKKITLSIPIQNYQKIKISAGIFSGGNLTSYINNLIAKDLEQNFDKYEALQKMIENK